MEIVPHPSMSFSERKGGGRVELIVLHYTAMKSAEAALERLCDPAIEVSTHYLVARDGQILRLVMEEKRAWHAGEGRWAGREDINSRSIGIELDNDGVSEFAEPLMVSLEALLEDLLTRHHLPPKAVIGHSDMAPGRKADPGRLFDWARLAEKELSVWPEPYPDSGDFLHNAAYFGYPVEYGQAAVLEAFRQRFRPFASGPIGTADRALMAGLARQHPIDVTERIASRTPSRPLRPME